MILDTNALSAYLDGTPEAVEIISEASQLEIPVIVAGEFAFGIAQSRHREVYERSLDRMIRRCNILCIDIDTARHYASIRRELKAADKPIPANDIWISSLCRQYSLPIMSRDVQFDFCGRIKAPNLVRMAPTQTSNPVSISVECNPSSGKAH